MYIREFLSKDYPAFQENDEIEAAAALAKDFGFSHVFIRSKGRYLGALSQEFLEEAPEGKLSSLQQHYEKFGIAEDSSMLDAVKIFHIFNANVIPVLSRQEKYLGYISCDDVFGEFSRYPLFSENGAVLTVLAPGNHYSFTEIAKIVESHNAKLYGCYVSRIDEEGIHITLKISQENLTSIDEALERFGYIVTEKYYSDEKEELMKDRYQFFQKYLEL